jgi:two-component system OmpR family sensor kinase
MEGFEGALAASLRFRLSVWLSCAIALIGAAAGAFSFVSALDEAHDLQDNQLRQTAYLISRLDAVPASPLARERVGDPDFNQRVVVRYLRTASGEPAPRPVRPPEFSDLLSDGLQTVSVGRELWRVYVRTNKSGVRVAVGQQTQVRDSIALASAARTLMPLLVLMPLLALLVTLLVRHMFRPLRQLEGELERRSEHDLAELSRADLPSEVWPFVSQINHLLQRVSLAISAQRRFIADAAHEMRSPMTAMSLQADRLAAADMPIEARSRLLDLIAGLHRTRELLDQMLTLARTQEDSHPPREGVSVQNVMRDVLEDLAPLAEEKEIDLGVVDDVDADVLCSPVELKILIKNLIDNAIRYTPERGRVDIAWARCDAKLVLQIVDTGPGIPPAERERVFDPFYRILGNGKIGSGLGLAIARTVAERMGAEIQLLASNTTETGLRVHVVFPADGEPGRS